MKITKREVPARALAGFNQWLAGRPASVQKLAEEFPFCCVLEIELEGDPVEFYLIGYTEDDSLLVSPVDPIEDYAMAMLMKRTLCAGHFREPH